jgi:hypothetical protein
MGSRKRRGVSRRKFLKGAVAASAVTVAGRGIYSLLDEYPGPTRAYAATTTYREEQYLIDNLEVVVDNGQAVIIPPIHNDVFTANLQPASPWGPWTKANLLKAQKQLEDALVTVQRNLPATAAGLTIVVAWGLHYFDTYVPGPWGTYAPREYNSSNLAVLPAIRFPSDDQTSVVLENNDIAFKMRSDDGGLLTTVENQLFGTGPNDLGLIGNLFDLTSKRIGFAGRGFGTPSAGKRLAIAAGVDGADSIPDKAQLMLGFTSTQANALGPDNIPSFETLRNVTNQVIGSYFANGTAMHLSHLFFNDIKSWYGRSYDDRVHRMFNPNTAVPSDHGTVTLANGTAQVRTAAQVKDEALTKGMVGHNSALQTATRLGADTVDRYGRVRRKGTPVPAREDFNTLDAPFFWMKGAPNPSPTPNRPGLHFAVFVPASGKFHTARTAMDGVLPDGTDLRLPPYNLTQDKIGFNTLMQATHRQNYLVPPRRHRSFPLAELLP